MPFRPHRRRRAQPLAAALLVALGALLVAAVLAGPARADATQVSILQDDPQLLVNPGGALSTFRQLGAQQVRVAIRWQFIAPSATSFKAPRGFNAANPAAYPNAKWAPYDTIVKIATLEGMQVNFNVVGGAPLWATGPGMPHQKGYPFYNWEPSASDFGQFMRALATRYSGNYDPFTKRIARGNKSDLPRVSFWSIWNEPDYGPSLAPQALPGHPTLPYSPRMYRQLVDAAWGALRATGHGSDGVLVGEIAPRATTTPFGLFNGMLPLTFVQSLYCLDSSYHQLRGVTAALEGCPATAAGSRRFVVDNPPLFSAAGFSDHPYMRWFPPNDEENVQANVDKPYPKAAWAALVKGFTSLGTISNLTTMLNRSLAAYGSHRHLPIWNTEFGYITSPPKRIWKGNTSPYVSPTTAAAYDNWAEYLSWKNPQIASFEQYLLKDPQVPNQADNYGGFASGLIAYNGVPKPGFAAWRFPVYLPITTAASFGTRLEVWGDARPVYYALRDFPIGPEDIQVLYRPLGTTKFSVLDTLAIKSSSGYVDARVAFPSSGTLELAWSYPSDPLFGSMSGLTIYSRQVQVSVHTPYAGPTGTTPTTTTTTTTPTTTTTTTTGTTTTGGTGPGGGSAP